MISGLSAARNRELVEQGLEINIRLAAKYAKAAEKSAKKLGRQGTAEAFGLISDQVADAFDELHPRQQTFGRAV